MHNLVLGIQIALLFSGCIIGGILLGVPIGRFLGISPWGIIVGVVLGIILAFFAATRIIREK